MILPSIFDIENSLLQFRIGRRLVLQKLLCGIAQADGIVNPYQLFSRLFSRLKSSDSVLEKIKRKGIVISNITEITEKIPDILGFRIITEDIDELYAIDHFLNSQFDVVSRLDQVTQSGEFGNRGIEYSLQYQVNGAVYPFEVQLRTFLQHYWSSKSFHLFHKKPRETALNHLDSLLSLSQTLERAEQIASGISDNSRELDRCASLTLSKLPLCTQIHLVVVESGEQFAAHIVQQLSGNDQEDHSAIVSRKLELYNAYPCSAIVECSCQHFSSFVFNEPQVWVPIDRLGKVVW